MNLPDWKSVENKLYSESITAINSFTAEYPEEEVCYFAFDSDPVYGYVLICFDTTENSVSEARRQAQRSIEIMREYLASAWNWQTTKSMLISSQVLPFTNNTGDFQYQGYAEVKFPEWEKLAESEKYPQGDFEGADDYLEANVSVVFWRVIDRLIEEGKFSMLRMSSPFYVGYGFHDDDQIILRILNW
jgi:hypothetical protein